MRRELEVGLAGVKCRKCVLIANVLALDQSYSVRIVCRAQRAGRGLGQSEVPKVRYDRKCPCFGPIILSEDRLPCAENSKWAWLERSAEDA